MSMVGNDRRQTRRSYYEDRYRPVAVVKNTHREGMDTRFVKAGGIVGA